jgi:hypothetical protein
LRTGPRPPSASPRRRCFRGELCRTRRHSSQPRSNQWAFRKARREHSGVALHFPLPRARSALCGLFLANAEHSRNARHFAFTKLHPLIWPPAKSADSHFPLRAAHRGRYTPRGRCRERRAARRTFQSSR